MLNAGGDEENSGKIIDGDVDHDGVGPDNKSDHGDLYR